MWGSQNWSFSRESVPITSRIVASCASDHHSLGVRHCCWDGLETDRYRADPAAGTSVPHQTCGLRDAPPPLSCPNLPVQPHPLPPSGTSVTVDESTFRQTRDRQWGHWTDKGETAWTEGKRTDRGDTGQTEGERTDRGETGQTEGERTDRGETGQTGGRMDRERRDMGESGQTMDRLT